MILLKIKVKVLGERNSETVCIDASRMLKIQLKEDDGKIKTF